MHMYNKCIRNIYIHVKAYDKYELFSIFFTSFFRSHHDGKIYMHNITHVLHGYVMLILSLI